MSQPALAAPAPVYPLEDEVREALEICGGDPMKALRITLIANAFLEAQIEHLSAAVSPGFARRKPRSSRNSSAISTEHPCAEGRESCEQVAPSKRGGDDR